MFPGIHQMILKSCGNSFTTSCSFEFFQKRLNRLQHLAVATLATKGFVPHEKRCGKEFVAKLFLLIVPLLSLLTVFVLIFLQKNQLTCTLPQSHTVTIKFHFTLKHQLQGMDNVLQQTSICLIL